MIRRRYLYAGAGVASFLLFLFANVPAGVITDLLSENLPENSRMGGIEGTIWNGSLRSLEVNGVQLRDTQWDLHPAGLLLGRLSASVTTWIAGSEFSADASMSLSGTMIVNDLEAAGPIAPVATRFNLPITGGRFEIRLSELEIADGWPTRLIGTGQVSNVPLDIMGGNGGPAGSYTVVFDAETVPEDGRLTGMISDNDGPVEVDGNIVVTPPGNFEFRARILARPEAPGEITRAISLAGPAGPDGRREISLAGSL